ncbi:phosphotransferase enzyme family protein [Paenibacillus ginsengarvi]|uniref:Aminoglycoside phosphotransferase domain-containing protein n=1 Tax=Paenibacillus ginsengarvi TaxID=400777 RepID=A0A3B0CK10_9BACL|nr:phosphotransferase [Paenibacillus ginsengarvi]RKN85743.1 hypothetical protein D7M11_05215 [Paenibacillus ginsengarvi]
MGDSYERMVQHNWRLTNVSALQTIEGKGNRSIRVFAAAEGIFALKTFDPALPEERIVDYTGALVYLQDQRPGISPKLVSTAAAGTYIRHEHQYMYLMEYIQGRQLEETEEDEYKLGRAAASLHRLRGCPVRANLNVRERIADMCKRFHAYPFKSEYDRIIGSLPDFDALPQSFIHTDIGPHNAMMSAEGNVVFIDLDDAGEGSTVIDAGYPLIAQFVRFDPHTGEIRFNAALARAFYAGYFSMQPVPGLHKELLFDGAVFMQLMYMPCYGESGIMPMWELLAYAIRNRDAMLKAIG